MQSTEYIDFRQYWFAIRRRWLPATAVFGFVVVLTALNTLLQKPVYEAKGRLLIKRPNNVTSAIQENLGQEKLSTVGRESDPLDTEIELIRSASIAQRTIATLNLELKLKPKQLLKQLSVRKVAGTDILEISYQSLYPKEAAVVVNQVMNLYLNNNVGGNRTEAVAAREFIVSQLPRTKYILDKAELSLRSFEEKNNVVDLEGEATSAVGVIANLENQVSEAQAKLADANTQSEALRSKLAMNSQEAVDASSLSQSPGVQRALEELQKVESDLALAQARYLDTHPTVVDLKSKKEYLESLLTGRVGQVIRVPKQEPKGNLQVGALKQQITADLVRLEAGRLGLASQVSALSNVLAAYKQRTNALPKLKQQKRQLERDVEAGQSTYETLLKRLEEIRVEEYRSVGNARLVEVAQVPEGPIAANMVRTLALGNLLGILLAITTALVLDALDTSIKTVKQAREVFGYTLLGMIPFFGKSLKTTRNRDSEDYAARIIVRDTPCSPISEAYRILKANLSFLSSDKELKVIVVTSSIPQEGKSTVSANLAVAMAQSERRVLLVDADMRRPVQHKIWNLLNEAGLSNVLVGQAELKTVIKEVMGNLHVLSAGVTPPNPMNLLESKRMASLIENFSENYDFVIIDTPSLNVAADAPILGKMADGILLVVRPGVVDSASAASAKEFLEQSGQNVLGHVVNGAISENKHNSYYYTNEYYTEEDSTTRKKVMSKAGRNV